MSFKFDREIICPQDPTASEKRIQQYMNYYGIKYSLCKDHNPKVIAEIGVRAGYSAWSFLQGCPDAKYIGIDANNGTHGGQGGADGKYFKWTEHILKDYNTELIELDTQKVDKLNIGKVDFFHVDGDHTVEGVQHDLDLAMDCINDDGVILIDDITYLDTVTDGVNKWIEKNKTNIKHKFVESLRGEMLIYKKETV